MEKRYGLPVAIAVVVGTVIGSGIFFKAETVLVHTGGNMVSGVLAFLIMGAVMLISTCTFGVVARCCGGETGLVGFARTSCSRRYGYYVGWFMVTIYYPSLVAVLSWLPARYFCVLMDWPDPVVGGRTMVLAAGFLVVTFGMNALAPRLAGRFQVATTIIKLIPLLLMAAVGTVAGLRNGMMWHNLTTVVDSSVTFSRGLFGAVVALAFAFEGWICAATIGGELRRPERDLPKALVVGAIIVTTVYVVYYMGLSGAVESAALMENGESGAKLAFRNVFGGTIGSLLFVFVVISCWGTCNGLTMAVTRGMHELAREEHPRLAMFRHVDPATGMPANSAIFGLLTTVLWLLYFYGGTIMQDLGPFRFDSSELPIITLYVLYVPIYLSLMRDRELGAGRRLVLPVLAILCSAFMVFAAVYSHGWDVAWYLLVFAALMAVGAFLRDRRPAAAE